ncbi:hypothetical protein LCGC14_2952030, partial [marine sediment metagenome]
DYGKKETFGVWNGYTEDDYLSHSRSRYSWHQCVCGKNVGIPQDGKAECWHCERKWIHSRHSDQIYPLTTYAEMDIDIAQRAESGDDIGCYVCDGKLIRTFVADENSLMEKTYICEWCESKYTAFVIDGIEELSLVDNDYTETSDGCDRRVYIGCLTSTQSDNRVCNECLGLFRLCRGCNEWFGVLTGSNNIFCPQCTKDRAREKVCKFCAKKIIGKVWTQADSHDGEVRFICVPCITRRFFQCDECEGMYEKMFSRPSGEIVLCPNCNVKRIKNKRKEKDHGTDN